MQNKQESKNTSQHVTFFSRINREDQVESFMRLSPESFFLPENIDVEMNWVPGTASSCLSKMYAKGKLYRVLGHRGLSGRTCSAYRIRKAGDPHPDMKAIRCVTKDEVFLILKIFLKKQDPETFFIAEDFLPLDPRLSAIYSHLAFLTKQGLLERKKIPRGKKGQKVYGYRLPLSTNPSTESPSVSSLSESSSVSLEYTEPMELCLGSSASLDTLQHGVDLKSTEPMELCFERCLGSSAIKQECEKSISAVLENSEKGFSKQTLLCGVFNLFNADTMESFWMALHSEAQVQTVRDHLQAQILDHNRVFVEAQIRLNYSNKLLDTLEKTIRLLELQRLIDERKKLAADFDDGDLFDTFIRVLPHIPLN